MMQQYLEVGTFRKLRSLQIRELDLVLALLLLLITGSTALNCQKCYRLEECPKPNCSDVYNFVNTVYRQNFFIEKELGLPICPEQGDDFAWKKLEIDGFCGTESTHHKNQACSVSSFEISGPGLGRFKMNGVLLGCSKPFLVTQLLHKYDCLSVQRRYEKYRAGVKDPRNRYVDLLFKLKQCRNNCTGDPKKCDMCFEDGCVRIGNSEIRLPDPKSQALPISLALLGLALFLSGSAICTYFCDGDRPGRLDLIEREDGSVQEMLIDRK